MSTPPPVVSGISELVGDLTGLSDSGRRTGWPTSRPSDRTLSPETGARFVPLRIALTRRV